MFKAVILIYLNVVTSGTEKPQRPVVLPVGVRLPWLPKQNETFDHVNWRLLCGMPECWG